MNELLSKLNLWRKHLEAKGLRVNMGKTKIMICSRNLHSLKDSRKHPCGVCCKGIGSNSIFCGCKPWIHKVSWKLVPSIDVNDVYSFEDQWMVDLKSIIVSSRVSAPSWNIDLTPLYLATPPPPPKKIVNLPDHLFMSNSPQNFRELYSPPWNVP